MSNKRKPQNNDDFNRPGVVKIYSASITCIFGPCGELGGIDITATSTISQNDADYKLLDNIAFHQEENH